jgi:hypothetical protein
VGGDHRRTVPGGDRQVVRVGEAADVVADARPRGERSRQHGGPPRVDGDGQVEPGHDGLDRRHDPIHLLLLADRLAGSGLDPAHVEDVGAVGDVRGRLVQERVEVVVPPGVVERVRRPIEDAHDQGPVGDVELRVAQRQPHHGDPTAGAAELDGARGRRP